VSARIIASYRDLAALLEAERQRGRTIALTNGCFDLIHVGHVRLLRDARQHGDVLVVALNDDVSARGNKGPDRPWVPLDERMEVIGAVEGVDYVTSFGEPTAHALLETLRPDVHVKGTDWTEETVPERDVTRSYGGRVAIVGDSKLHSSSDLIRRLRRQERP
jgi:rfaE bifunctional protein nucleotidyltransferase chain/domain